MSPHLALIYLTTVFLALYSQSAPSLLFAPATQPLRHKLIHLLALHLASPPPAIASRLGRVYLVTMPAFLGKEGINPLSVWFCYDKQDDPATKERKLWSVILEVHNTFGERHVYVLEVGKGEDEKVPIGSVSRSEACSVSKGELIILSRCAFSPLSIPSRSKHRWTFPRSFHVSPFNSRDGYYTLSLLPPTFPPSASNPTSPIQPITLSISLLLLTPSKTPKLFARLSSTPHTPPLLFTARNILVQTLLKFPVALLATTPRIMWNAGVLAFSKGLRVYGRPEQVGRKLSPAEDSSPPTPAEDSGVGSSEEEDASPEGVKTRGERPLPDDDWGKVQTSPASHPGGLVWLPLSATEVRARELAVQYLHSRLATLFPGRRIKVVITPSEPHLPTTTITSPRLTSSFSTDDEAEGEEEVLHLLPVSPVAFTLLLLSPTATHSLATLARPGPSTLLHISNPSLFLTLFTPPPPPTPIVPSLPLRALHLIRARNPLSPASVRALFSSGEPHWVDSLGADEVGWKLVAGVGGTVLAEWMEEGVMRGLGVGFVKGGEGWRGVWRGSA